MEEQVAWGRCYCQPTAPCAYAKALEGHADPFTWPGRCRVGSKVTKEAVWAWSWSCFLTGRCFISLSLVAAEVLSQSPLVPPPNCLLLPCQEKKGSWLALAVLTPYLMWPKSVLPVLLRNLEVVLAAARAVVRSLIPQEEMLQGPVLSGQECLCLNLGSLQMGLWEAKPSAGMHCTKQIQVCEWPESLFKESKHNLLHWRQRPYMLCIFACIVLCICLPNYGISSSISTSWPHRIQMQGSGLQSKCVLYYY